jgi:hypothetical protein
MDIPMLDEREWQEVVLLLTKGIEQIKQYRIDHGVSLAEAKHVYGDGALQRYFEITGFRETNVNALWHHRLALLGPLCSACGKPLRTPRAKMCAACGASVCKSGSG